MTDQSEKKAAPSHSISGVSVSEKSSDYLVTITHDGKAVGEVIIRTTSTAAETSGAAKSR